MAWLFKYSNLEMEAECQTKNLSYLNSSISRTKKAVKASCKKY